nr:unnamed protein product [Digitaria exilis]
MAVARAHGVLLRAMEGAADVDSSATLDSMAPLFDSTMVLLDLTTDRASVELRWLRFCSLPSGCCSVTSAPPIRVDTHLHLCELRDLCSLSRGAGAKDEDDGGKHRRRGCSSPSSAKEAMARTWREGSALEMGSCGEETQLCVAPRRRRKMGLVDGSFVGAGFGDKKNTVDDAKWVWVAVWGSYWR